MLYVALVSCGIMLLGSNLAVRHPKHPIAVAIPWLAGPCVLPLLIGFISATAWELGIVLGLLSVFAGVLKFPKLYLPLSLLTAVLVFGFNSWSAWNRIERLR